VVGTRLDAAFGSGVPMECPMAGTEATGAIPCYGDGVEAEAIHIRSVGTSRGCRGGGGQCPDIPATGVTLTLAMARACHRRLTDPRPGHQVFGSIQRLHSRVSSKPDRGMGS
jgi:hypothetical protein